MFKTKKLHPIAAITSFFKSLKDVIFPIILFIILDTKINSSSYIFFGLIGIGLTGLLIISFIQWYRFTYEITDNQIKIVQGLFVKKNRYIPFERIQSIDIQEGIIHRFFQLALVKIETAGSSGLEESDAILAAIPKTEAFSIKEYINSVKHQKIDIENESDNEHTGKIIYQMPNREIFMFAVTSGGVGVIISAVFAFLSQFDEFIPFESVFEGIKEFIKNSIFLISLTVFIFLLIAYILAIIITFIKYYSFTVRKIKDDLIISRGLLEKKELTIPLSRIQAIRVEQSIIRHLFGYVTVYIESAGGSVTNNESINIMLLPLIKKSKLKKYIEECLPEYTIDVELTGAPRRSAKRYMLRTSLVSLPIIGGLSYFLFPWGLFSFALLPLTIYWGYLSYLAAGWNISNKQLVLRHRIISTTTFYLPRNRIQDINITQTIFQKKSKVGSISAFIKSGGIGKKGIAVDLSISDINNIYKWLSQEDKTLS